MAPTRSLMLLAALALAPACASEGSTAVVVNDPVDDTVAEGHARGFALAEQGFAELIGNDYLVQIGMTASILGAFHDGEILQGDFAVQVVEDAAVFDFANELIIDHEDASFELDSVMRFYGIGYVPSLTAYALAADISANLGLLRGTPPGEVDFVYVEIQVIQHAQAQILLDELYAIVGDGELGFYILETQDMIDAHLDHAANLLATYY